MSERSFKRDRARAEASARRRQSRRARRASLATGAAIGATVVFAPAASAASFEVTSLADGAPDACDADCTIRDAVVLSNQNDADDTITFATGLSGTITLTQGDLEVYDQGYTLSITDTGTDEVTISGDADSSGGRSDGDSRIFFVAPYTGLSLTGLDLTLGAAEGGSKYDAAGGAIFTTYESTLNVTDSTITDSYGAYGGGGIFNFGGDVTITNSQITDNGGFLGGGVRSSGDKYVPDGFRAGDSFGDGPDAQGEASVTITGSTIGGNEAAAGGGIFSSGEKYADDPTGELTTLNVTDSEISGNGATFAGGSLSKYSDTTIDTTDVVENESGSVGGLGGFAGNLAVSDSTITGNSADQSAGGIGVGKYGTLDLAASEVTNNYSGYGGGILIGGDPTESPFDGATPGDSTISNTTIAGNEVYGSGAGVEVSDLVDGETLTIRETTISGNDAANEDPENPTYGGGISVYGAIGGDFRLVNSTVSGNSAAFGGGISFDSPYEAPPPVEPRSAADSTPGDGTIAIDNSTIAANFARQDGGGMYLGSYDSTPGDPEPTFESITVPLSSTIVGDNTVGGSANDLAQTTEVDVPGGGFRLTNSLVEAPGSATVSQAPAGSSILGADPQLGTLADNGGPTRTHLPASTSPAIDTGLANGLATDQRGLPRTVDSAFPNGAGDGTDIGSVEVQNPTPPRTRALQRDEVPANCDVPFDGDGLRLAGDDGDQTIDGSPNDDILRGYGGNDTVLGVGGDDCLTGDSGDDIVEGGDGNDSGNGGDGIDFLSGGGGDDEMRGADDDDNVKLGGGDDKGVGGGGDDRVKGNGGDDAVRGRFGADKVFGDKGDDAVRGGGGNDLVKGGSGANELRGGAGDDTIVLAKGSSNIVNCGKGEDVVKGASKRDEIAGNCETVK